MSDASGHSAADLAFDWVTEKLFHHGQLRICLRCETPVTAFRLACPCLHLLRFVPSSDTASALFQSDAVGDAPGSRPGCGLCPSSTSIAAEIAVFGTLSLGRGSKFCATAAGVSSVTTLVGTAGCLASVAKSTAVVACIALAGKVA